MRDEEFMEGGHGEVIALRLWETELMIHLRMQEDEYLKIPKPERARKVVALKLKGWFEMLEFQVSKQKWEEERRRQGRK